MRMIPVRGLVTPLWSKNCYGDFNELNIDCEDYKNSEKCQSGTAKQHMDLTKILVYSLDVGFIADNILFSRRCQYVF